jgi:hypothetical protein
MNEVINLLDAVVRFTNHHFGQNYRYELIVGSFVYLTYQDSLLMGERFRFAGEPRPNLMYRGIAVVDSGQLGIGVVVCPI